MEALLGSLVNIVPEIVIGALIVAFVVYWQRETIRQTELVNNRYRALIEELDGKDNRRDKRYEALVRDLRDEQREQINAMLEVVNANTQVLERFCTTTSLIDEIRDALLEASDQKS